MIKKINHRDGGEQYWMIPLVCKKFIHFGQHPEETVESIKLSMYGFLVSTADRIRKLRSNISELANQSMCAGQLPSANIGRDLSLPRCQFP